MRATITALDVRAKFVNGFAIDTNAQRVGDTFSWFDNDDLLLVEQRVRQVRVFYACCRASRGNQDTTFLDGRFELDASEAWIGRLQVSTKYRLQGLGRELVLAAERISSAIEMREIKI